ncbi:MAG: hypothetical protein HYU98_07110 [Deltaproteobacteria bacterium]|nr:hypothetical protein [Deltaproteobacteria bacterium]
MRLSGPDVNGDGEDDQLTPTQLDVQYEGDKAYCKEMLECRFSPQMLSNVTWNSSGKFALDVYKLDALSSAGMEKTTGASWKKFANPTIGGMSIHQQRPNAIFLSAFSLLDLSNLAYSGDEYEGSPEIKEWNDSSGKDDTKITHNPDGSISYRGGWSNTYTYTKTVKGTPKRSSVTVDGITSSQLKGALEIPHGSEKIRIGTNVRVTYKYGVPKWIKEKYPSSVNGNMLDASVINFSQVFYQKTVDGKYNMLTGSVMLTIAPLGEQNILNGVDINLHDIDSYTIEVQRPEIPQPQYKTPRYQYP